VTQDGSPDDADGSACQYGEFLNAGEEVSTNTLADRLARLEACGIVRSAPDPENRRAKRYRLTRKGIDLAPMMVEMILWSAQYDPDTATSKAFVRRARRDREKLLADLTAHLEAEAERPVAQ
jgi:DNA-binding HxlR family transcriptional regulator